MYDKYKSYKDTQAICTLRYVPNGRLRYNSGSISRIKPKLIMSAGHSELEQVLYNMSGKYKSVLTVFSFVPLQKTRICLSINICINAALSMWTIICYALLKIFRIFYITKI